jgi:hypothetical protein
VLDLFVAGVSCVMTPVAAEGIKLPDVLQGLVAEDRDAYLQALSNVLMFGLTFDSVYPWTLLMFHCRAGLTPERLGYIEIKDRSKDIIISGRRKYFTPEGGGSAVVVGSVQGAQARDLRTIAEDFHRQDPQVFTAQPGRRS